MNARTARWWQGLRAHDSFHPCLPAIAAYVQHCVNQNDACPRADTKTLFDSIEPPALSLERFLAYLCSTSQCGPQVWPVAFVYILRLARSREGTLTSLSAHRIVLAAYVSACKMYDDEYTKSSEFARRCHIRAKEINLLTRVLLCHTKWALFVTREEYEAAVQFLKAPEGWHSEQ
eukprot:Hpha_TRINITY_DN15538_c1_g2::TRINITY_DN15538_c1_g2_i1::g.106983::m.106983